MLLLPLLAMTVHQVAGISHVPPVYQGVGLILHIPKNLHLPNIQVPHRTTVPLVYHIVGSILHIPNDLPTATRSLQVSHRPLYHQYISVGSVYQGVGLIPHIPKDLSTLTKVQVPPGYDNKDCPTARGR